MPFGKKRELKKTKVEIIPMIDTMFFLLVFFILSSIGVVKLQGLNIDLPQSSSVSTPQKKIKTADMTVVIDKNERITVDNKPVTGDDIGPILVKEMTRQLGPNYDTANASVIISADPVVRHGTVVRCIDQARQQNITNFAIATKEDNGTTGVLGAAPAAPAAGGSQ